MIETKDIVASIIVIGLVAWLIWGLANAPQTVETYHKETGIYCIKEKEWRKPWGEERCYQLKVLIKKTNENLDNN